LIDTDATNAILAPNERRRALFDTHDNSKAGCLRVGAAALVVKKRPFLDGALMLLSFKREILSLRK
jgi:hypothetical protein